MSLQFRFWGTRGSIPSPGAQTVRYGGNTPSIEVRGTSGNLTILDAGTGMRALGRRLMEQEKQGPLMADVFISHAHWDHIHGIPFFAPLFSAGNCFRIWGTNGRDRRLERVVRDQMAPVVFPVPFDGLPSTVEFRDVVAGESYGSDCVVTAMPVQHPGGALGYRVSMRGDEARALVYISDNELDPGTGFDLGPEWRSELVRWVGKAKVLVHDATYTASEYAQHRGWGHSTCDQAVELALECGVEQLVLFHHNPERTDEELDRIVEHCTGLVMDRGGRLQVVAAAEGMELTV